jgi:hypothetical protein
MRKKSKLAGAIAGAALTLGAASQGFAAANCGDINASGGTPDAVDSVGLAQVVLGGGTPVAGHCGASGTLQCGDVVDDNVINSQDLVASLQIAAGIETLLTPCTGFGPTLACNSTVSGTINSNQVWPTGCDTFVDGTTFISNGAVITVQAGATVKGRKSSTNATPSALIFLRGTKINAAGTAALPIVMTSDQTPGTRARADWGGVTLLGSAPVNFPGGEGGCEGLPPGTCNFGGSEPNDSSGQVRFTRIEFSGVLFSTDNELNVFTMNGVGRGTTVDHVQANVGDDDGIEWFGGTVNGKYLVATSVLDDIFDWQIGYTGSNQFGLGYHNVAVQIASGHNGFEGDNNENGFDNTPRSNPEFCNFTVIGSTRQGVTSSGAGANVRRGTAGKIANTILMDFTSAGLDIDDDATLARGCTNATTLQTTEPVLRVQDTILHNNAGGALQTIGSTTAPACTPNQLAGLWQTGEGLIVTATNPLPGITATYPSSVDNRYFPTGGGEADGAPDCALLRPEFFDPAPYIGGFEPGGGTPENWLVTAGNWISFATN